MDHWLLIAFTPWDLTVYVDRYAYALLLEAVHFNDVGLVLIYTSFFEIDWVDYPAKIKVPK